MKWYLCVAYFALWTISTAASTPTPNPRQALDLTATQIWADYTATAAAFPVPLEQATELGSFTFALTIGSMLLVLLPLAFAAWRMNKRS